jgi:hypothetical protein
MLVFVREAIFVCGSTTGHFGRSASLLQKERVTIAQELVS